MFNSDNCQIVSETINAKNTFEEKHKWNKTVFKKKFVKLGYTNVSRVLLLIGHANLMKGPLKQGYSPFNGEKFIRILSIRKLSLKGINTYRNGILHRATLRSI